MTNELNKRFHHHNTNIINNKEDNNTSVRDYGVRVFMGIGGSATNDGGLGALQALGLDIYVNNEEERNSDNK